MLACDHNFIIVIKSCLRISALDSVIENATAPLARKQYFTLDYIFCEI